ncbi:MAG: 50S ribosomal protein L6 [Desulfuromonas sp.]|uniref:50S ribosomal protein L6 n=1 Tax=Desulfuromonas sp. TaxID=892 RepID=UPI000CB7C133|nr:50S ribosomal protein L6 [Desulfuromonas sp.]PLX83576.1 MAG: 50S ribosomal protein L6 [Desulfuromonas sp.]
MSRIGKKPVEIPSGVKVGLDGNTLTVQGPKGNLSRELPSRALVEVEADQILIRPNPEERTTAIQGLTRSLIANMVEGVSKGFEKVLEINGVGYRAELKGKALNLALGYSHPIEYPLPEGVSAEVEPKANRITVRGIDKEMVGATAAKIRSFRSPEPYKGKGIKYLDERIIRKAGKTGK